MGWALFLLFLFGQGHPCRVHEAECGHGEDDDDDDDTLRISARSMQIRRQQGPTGRKLAKMGFGLKET